MNTSRPHLIGLFGGTFDPIHFGHLRPAVELREHFELDTLNLLPNHRPAHRDHPTASTAQRIDMLQLAINDIPQLQVDVREAERDKPSYTVDTLTEYRLQYPDASFVFFLGIDAFSKFDSWHRWEDILSLTNLVVIDRPESTLSDWASALIDRQTSRVGDTVSGAHAGAIERFAVTQLAISATDIRQRIGAGKSVDFLLPGVVKQYIVRHGLYQG